MKKGKLEKLQFGFVRVHSLIFSLCALLLLSCNGLGKTVEPEIQTWKSVSPLREIYADDFLLGNIISPRDMDSERIDILRRHYNILTAENHMKPEALAPAANPGSVNASWNYRFGYADGLVNSVRAAGMKMHAHTLIWHSQSPAWLAEGGEPYLNKYVTDVVTHFKGKVISWDVVNEAFRDGLTKSNVTDGNWKDCLRTDSPWYKSMGADYIEKAFLAARAADPDAKLYYNDYNLNRTNMGYGNESYKGWAVYYMVKEINDKYRARNNGRNLIDGIGMQSHHHLNTNPETVRASLESFISLGVEIGITELDITASGSGVGEWGDTNAQRQAKLYAALMGIFKEYSQHITRVTFWGIDDGTSWRRDGHATLLNNDYTLKPAFFAVMNPDKP